MTKQTLTFVSHTHWDREWYQPFEEYRVRLVQLVDKLLGILEADPGYKYFMLDGQAIVLEDYLAIRPEKERQIAELVAAGRLQIGPWYILPDEFLVAPESTIRNLLVGGQVCARFGKRMDVGNIPDPFGHISQLPQILRGFDIDCAAFWRGVSGVQNEFTWAAPDGSEVLAIHQHDSYGNASGMPADPEAFIARTQQIVERLTPTATTPHLLAMNGSDHVEPMPELPRLLAAADAALPDVEIGHGTLPQFVAAVRAAGPALETMRGELRDPATAPLLTGVLSARMWIKQRNAACETLLTHWAEPLSALAEAAGAPLALHGQSALVRQAWRTLLQNHPHDSICGCSIDQVHKEMDVRFDWVTQIGEEVVTRSSEALASIVDTASVGDDAASAAVIVMNGTTRPRTDRVTARVPVPEGAEGFALLDRAGRRMPLQVTSRERDVIEAFDVDVETLRAYADMILGGYGGEMVQHVAFRVEGKTLFVEVEMGRGQTMDEAAFRAAQSSLYRLLDEGDVEGMHIVVHRGTWARCAFLARDVPGMGCCTYRVVPSAEALDVDPAPAPERPVIENAFLRVEVAADGTFTLTDKETGRSYPGLNRFVDVGDRGDEYNFCPVEQDVVVDAPSAAPLACVTAYGALRKTIEVSMVYLVPAELGEARTTRGEEWVDLPITTRVSLTEGVRRVEVETVVENSAADHRLRAHFPVPARVDAFHTEGHMDVIARPLDLPTDTETWVEQPVGTHPQRTWSDVSDGEVGLLVANRGLPEVEALRTEAGSELALTLLRCVGWLSRDDLSNRRGHAGPGLPTPGAQCEGEHTFHYALVPHRDDWRAAVDEAYAFALPLRAVATSGHGGTLPPDASFVEVTPGTLVLSAVKETEEGGGLVVRFWNTDTAPCEARVRLWRPFARAARCNLGERVLEPLHPDAEGAVRVPVRGREIVTLRFWF